MEKHSQANISHKWKMKVTFYIAIAVDIDIDIAIGKTFPDKYFPLVEM